MSSDGPDVVSTPTWKALGCKSVVITRHLVCASSGVLDAPHFEMIYSRRWIVEGCGKSHPESAKGHESQEGYIRRITPWASSYSFARLVYIGCIVGAMIQKGRVRRPQREATTTQRETIDPVGLL